MFFNISGITDVALISPGGGFSNAKTIHIVNTHASDPVLVDLYISTLSSGGSAASVYYILKSHYITSNEYFNLESDVLSFDNNSSTGHGLYIALNNTSSTVDVIIK